MPCDKAPCMHALRGDWVGCFDSDVLPPSGWFGGRPDVCLLCCSVLVHREGLKLPTVCYRLHFRLRAVITDTLLFSSTRYCFLRHVTVFCTRRRVLLILILGAGSDSVWRAGDAPRVNVASKGNITRDMSALISTYLPWRVCATRAQLSSLARFPLLSRHLS